MIFLNSEEIFELTGLKLASAQCRWLTNNGYPFDKSQSGKPKVLRSYLEQRLCPAFTNTNSFEEPNFGAI